MCGRYVRRSDKQQIAEAFHLDKLPEAFILPPDYNIAPSTFQPGIQDVEIGDVASPPTQKDPRRYCPLD